MKKTFKTMITNLKLMILICKLNQDKIKKQNKNKIKTRPKNNMMMTLLK